MTIGSFIKSNRAKESTGSYFQKKRRFKGATPTPKHLCLQAIALLSHYSKTAIVTKLRISTEQFNRWCITYKSPDELPHFIPLPQVTSLSTPLSIELKFTNGNALTLSGELDEQLVAQLIEAAKS